MIIPIIIFSLLLLYGLVSLLRRKKKTFQPLSVKEIEKAVKKAEKKKEQTKYPLFIPFYQWHGFFNGLHPENKRYYLSRGKEGRCPKNFKPIF